MTCPVKKSIEFPPWYGEFGWEVTQWVPYLRHLAVGFDYAVCTSFKGRKPLYTDFTCPVIFLEHDRATDETVLGYHREVDLRYKPKGINIRYGIPEPKYDVLLHNRWWSRKHHLAYKHWGEVVALLEGLKIACTGTTKDKPIDGIPDERTDDLQYEMDLISGAKCVAGVGCGFMNLVMQCDTPHVIWHDNIQHFFETYEQTYFKTHNPFNTELIYIKKTHPSPYEIADAIFRILKIRE